AQERAIAERDNKVHGLLTHALIKVLNEARPTQGDTISSADLKRILLQSWNVVCGEDAAPRPEITPPPSGEIFFRAKNTGVEFEIRHTPPAPPGWSITLRDGEGFKNIAQL